MSIRWIKDGEPHSAEVYNRPLRDYIQEADTTFAKQSLEIDVSNGLSGGGKLVGDKITIVGNDASTRQKGVVRFATLEEANEGTPGLVIGTEIIKNIVGTVIDEENGKIISNIGGMIVQIWKTTVYSNRMGPTPPMNGEFPEKFPRRCLAIIPIADHANTSAHEALEIAYSSYQGVTAPTPEKFHYYSNYTGVGLFVAIGY